MGVILNRDKVAAASIHMKLIAYFAYSGNLLSDMRKIRDMNCLPIDKRCEAATTGNGLLNSRENVMHFCAYIDGTLKTENVDNDINDIPNIKVHLAKSVDLLLDCINGAEALNKWLAEWKEKRAEEKKRRDAERDLEDLEDRYGV